MMNRQEAFNKMWNGLKSQGWQKSLLLSDEGQCAYRGSENLRCAIGWCIPDEKYHPDYDSVDDCPLLVTLLSETEIGDPKDAQWWQTCQRAHDKSESPADMEIRFRNLAEVYNLTIPE